MYVSHGKETKRPLKDNPEPFASRTSQQRKAEKTSIEKKKVLVHDLLEFVDKHHTINHPEKSAIAEHVLERNGSHDIDWHNVRVIDRATGMKERKVREAFAIEERKPAMNRDKGVEKSRTWNGLFTWEYIAPFTWQSTCFQICTKSYR